MMFFHAILRRSIFSVSILSGSILLGMMAGLLLLSAQVSLANVSSGQDPTWAERLGYPAGSKVLILHSDDVGMSYEANLATQRYFQRGEIQSASVMVPCPWFNEWADWQAKSGVEYDVGIHMTLTSEWKTYRWPGVLPRSDIASMIDRDGYLWGTAADVARRASPAQVAAEMQAQLDRAKVKGMRPTHIDTHMGTVYARAEFLQAYLDLAVRERIPAMTVELTPRNIEEFQRRGVNLTPAMMNAINRYPLPKLDYFVSVPKAKSWKELKKSFVKMLDQEVPVGLTEIVFHPSTSSDALKKITNSWQQRVWEGQLFSDRDIKKAMKKRKIIFTNWVEVMRRFDGSAP